MPERQVDLGELGIIFNHRGTKDPFLTPHFCACNSFLPKGEQFVGEECYTGFNESQSLGLIEVKFIKADPAIVKWKSVVHT